MKRLLFMLAYAITLGQRSLINTDLLTKLFSLIVFRHNITQRVFKMKEETPINRQLFPSKQATERVDQDRVNYYKIMKSVTDNEKPEEKIKKVINPNIFKEEIRRQQRQFRQSNHEFLKMCGVVARSSRDETKFGYIGDSHRKANNFAKGNANTKNAQKKEPLVHLSLDTTQFNCALLNDKVPIKDIYQLFPFRKESILFQSNEYLSSDYIFFFYQNQNPVSQNLKHKLQSTIEEGILAEFKSSISKNFKNIGFFDYLYFVNKKPQKSDREVIYPPYITQIAKSNSNFLARIDEDEKSKFNRDEISVIEKQTCERLIICQESDTVDNGESLCFQTIEQYTEYKKYKAINFKSQKILQKDAIINTNIRNIISTEKIYLVQIIEEVKSYIQLSRECEGSNIMKKVYEQITSKADQYLRLLCGYTKSNILTNSNIESYQEKIYMFIEKSIRYKKQIKKLPQGVLKEFEVLQIWYQLPENLLGYSRDELHDTFYQLMEAIIIFEEKMKTSEFYDSLKIKRPGVKYLK